MQLCLRRHTTNGTRCPPVTAMFVHSVIFSVLLAIVSMAGDWLVFKSDRVQKSVLVKALLDNVTHGILAGLSWLAIRNKISTGTLLESVSCLLIACFIDVDHFVASRSFSLDSALHLPTRPHLHNTTVFMAICLLLLWFGYPTAAWITLVAGVSHHLRDATRRGLWLAPFFTTPPIPYWLYVMCVSLEPYIFRLGVNLSIRSQASEKIQYV